MPKRKGRSLRSRRYKEMIKKFTQNAVYELPEAVTQLKNLPQKAKFDESVDLAIKLDIDTTQANQLVRGSFSLPNGTGKTVRVIAFVEGPEAAAAKEAGAQETGGEEMAKKILDGWMDFDVVIAHPSMMRHVGKLGKALGPRGLMPSPKSGSVTPNVAQAVKDFVGGKIEFRNDKVGNLNVIVGKLSFSQERLVENIKAFLDHVNSIRPSAVKGDFIKKATLSSTMGPGLLLKF